MIKILKIILCKFKFHRLDYKCHIFLPEFKERWVRYECPCCGEFQLKCYKTGKND